MHADATHMRDRLEPFEEAGQPAVVQGERVAATQQDFGDARVGADRFECAAKGMPSRMLLAVRKLAPEAVTAMDGAGARGHQQDAAVVLVQQSLSGQCCEIADRIRDQIKPACMPNCVRDTEPDSAGTVEPNCQLFEETFDNVRTAIEECLPSKDGSEWVAPPGATVCFATLTDKGTGTPSKIDNMSEECVDKGFNLEFILVLSLIHNSEPTRPD